MTTLDITGVRPKVLEILRESPTLSYSSIANDVGVTRERVRQIAYKNGYPPRQGKLTPKICPVCAEIHYRKSVHCSSICAYKARLKRVIVHCYHCGEPIERVPGALRRNGNGKYFCSRLCFYAKWNKENHSAIA